MPMDSLIDEYAAGPELLKNALADVDESVLDAVPIPGKWSIRQVICHLADYETVYSDRMKRVLAEDNPSLPAADPEHYSAALRYERRCVEEELQVIAAVRAQTARLLRHVDLEDFQRTGVHSEDGPLTLESLLERIVEHVPHHLKFIREKLTAIGLPIRDTC